MIGLKRNTVKIIPYSKEWSKYYNTVSEELSQKLNIKLSSFFHFGSTSIPECAAKPIIDVAIGLESFIEAGHYVSKLQKLNYGIPWTHVLPDRVCMPGKGLITTVNLYLVSIHSKTLRDWLKFRDLIKANNFLKEEYVALKTELADKYPLNRGAYTKMKTQFIMRVICQNS